MSGNQSTDWEKVGQRTVGGVNGFTKGNKAYHGTQGHNYKIQLNTSPVCQVNVIDKTARSAKAAAKNIPAKGDWVFRLDKPHKGAEFNHININPTISGIPDPHLKLPPGGLTTGKGVAKTARVINKINKVAVPLAIAVDAAQTGYAAYQDYEYGTTRNTVETVASVAGGWGGGYGGAVGGAAIGSAICPGPGTIIGGVVGGIGGGVGGSLGMGYAAEAIGDACDYDIIEKSCKKCRKKFKVRQYRGEKDIKFCQDCE